MSIRKNITLLIGGFLISQPLLSPPILFAQEAIITPSETDYNSILQEINFSVGDAELHIDQRYWGDLGTDSDVLKTLTEQIKAFWEKQNSSSGMELSSQALIAISQLSRASGRENDSEAREAVRSLKQHLSAIKALKQENHMETQRSHKLSDG